MIELRLSSSSVVTRSSASPSPSFGRRQLIRNCRNGGQRLAQHAVEAAAEERLEPALDMQADLEAAVQRQQHRVPEADASASVRPTPRIGRVEGAPAM